MLPVGGSTQDHDPEFDVVQWFPADEALQALTYANEAEVLRRAIALIGPGPSAAGRRKDAV
jgi:hypothetical protein